MRTSIIIVGICLLNCVRYEVFMGLKIQVTVFWVLMLCML